MSIHGIGMSDHSTAWRKRNTPKNAPGIPFASQIANADMAAAGSSLSDKANGNSAAAGRTSGSDHYVRSTSGLPPAGVYSKENLSATREPALPIETDRYKIEDASFIEGVAAYSIEDKEWYLTISHSDYSAAQKYLATGFHTSNYQTWLDLFPNVRLFDKDKEDAPRDLLSRGTLPGTESNSFSNEQDTKTRSEILVRPDGSRVLILTMEIAGMQAAMSLQISEPTDMPDSISDQEIESAANPVNAMEAE